MQRLEIFKKKVPPPDRYFYSESISPLRNPDFSASRSYILKLHLKLHLRLYLRLQLWKPKILKYLLYWFESIMYQLQNIYNVSTQSFLQKQLLFWFSRHELNISMTLMLLISYSFQLKENVHVLVLWATFHWKNPFGESDFSNFDHVTIFFMRDGN